jgi:heme/copper-type cytochrome/quinol oxidase subunit 2
LAASFRTAWAAHPSNVHVAIATLVFAYAGIILLFIVNLALTQQVVYTQHPQLRRSNPLTIASLMLLLIIIGAVFGLIAGIVLEFHWPPEDTSALALRTYGSATYAVIAFIPIPIVAISAYSRARRQPNEKTVQWGGSSAEGSMVPQVVVIVISASFLTIGAAYRLATLCLSPPSGDNPVETPWYLSRGSFYTFNFGIGLFVVCFWLILRVDEPTITSSGPTAFSVYTRDGTNAPQLSARELTRCLTNLQLTRYNKQPSSRVSWASGDGCSRHSAATFAKWEVSSSGGVSDDTDDDDDWDEVLMYYTDEDMSDTYSNFDVNGARSHMSWETSRDGLWTLRPASGLLPSYMRR